jgi:Uma2 family endonuclease
VPDNTSVALGPRGEPQPDAQLRIRPECGGRTQTDRRFVRGVPELVVEVSHTTRYHDLGPKLGDYERAGVLEYVVRALKPDEVLWHV